MCGKKRVEKQKNTYFVHVSHCLPFFFLLKQHEQCLRGDNYYYQCTHRLEGLPLHTELLCYDGLRNNGQHRAHLLYRTLPCSPRKKWYKNLPQPRLQDGQQNSVHYHTNSRASAATMLLMSQIRSRGKEETYGGKILSKKHTVSNRTEQQKQLHHHSQINSRPR